MPLEVTRKTLPSGVTVLQLRGRVTLGLDTRRLEETASQIEREGVTRLVFDLAGVDYMDSAGLGVLTGCAAAMRNARGAFHIAGANTKIRHLLKVTRLDQMIPSYPSAEEACAAFPAETR
jgi:anti-sigma B factor antagonist